MKNIMLITFAGIIIIIGLVGIIKLIDRDPIPDNGIIDRYQKRIFYDSISLAKKDIEIKLLNDSINEKNQIVDSLILAKQKVVYKYVERDHELDTFNVANLINEYLQQVARNEAEKSVFSIDSIMLRNTIEKFDSLREYKEIAENQEKTITGLVSISFDQKRIITALEEKNKIRARTQEETEIIMNELVARLEKVEKKNKALKWQRNGALILGGVMTLIAVLK